MPIDYLKHTGDQLVHNTDLLYWRRSDNEPGLEPLLRSHRQDDLESDLRDSFAEVFEDMIRDRVSRINTYGMPHRSDFAGLERFVKAAGLPLQSGVGIEPFMREIYRAWVARNPRRGTLFLRHYLQMLWPGKWTLIQLWHHPTIAYPFGLSETEEPGFFLTSRVRLYLDIGPDADGSGLAKLVGSFRGVLAARLVLEVITRELSSAGLVMGAAAEGAEHESFDSTV